MLISSKRARANAARGRRLLVLLRSDGERVGGKLDELMAPLRRGPSGPGYAAVLSWQAEMLEGAMADMTAADRGRLEALADVAAARRRRDAESGRAHRELVEIRRRIRCFFGHLDLLDFAGRTAWKGAALVEQARRVLAVLTDPGFELTPPKLAGVIVHPRRWLDGLRDAVAQLEAGDAELDRRAAVADRTLSAKGRAMERYENIYQGVKRVTEGLFRLAGERQLANRLRRRGIWRRAGGGRRGSTAGDSPGTWWPNAWEWVRQVLGIEAR